MKYIVEIVETDSSWSFDVYNGYEHIVSDGFDSFSSAVNEACQKLLLSKTTFDFGQGPVPANKHKNGGGWVAETANVDETVYVGPDAYVYGYARVHDSVKICDNARVYGNAKIYKYAKVYGQAGVYGDAEISDNSSIGGFTVVCGKVKLDGSTNINGRNFLWKL